MARRSSHVPFPRSPPMLVTGTILVWYHNQETDTGAIYGAYSVFTSDMHSFVCTYVTLCSLVTRVALCNHQHTQWYYYHKILCSHIHTVSHDLTFGNHESVFHLYNYVISQMLYKWNCDICIFLRLTLFTQHNFLKLHPNYCMDV